MATVAKISLALEAEASKVTSAAAAAGKGIKGIGDAADKAKEQVGGFRATLDKLREGAGRGSTLDDLGKTLAGAGALAGITLLGEQVAGVTGKVRELSEAFSKGEISAAGMAAKIGESLPVIGGFVKAGQDIREMFTHEQAQIDHINASIKAEESAMAAVVTAHEHQLAAQKQITEELRRSNQELALAKQFTEKGEYQVKQANAQADAAAKRKKDQEDYAKQVKDDLDKQVKGFNDASKAAKQVEGDRIRAAHSRYEGDDDDDNANILAEKLRKAEDAQDYARDRRIRKAQDEAKKEVEEHQKMLDQIAKQDANSDQLNHLKAAAKGVEDAYKKVVEGIQKAEEEAGKRAAERAKAAADAIKQLQDELKDLTSGATDNVKKREAYRKSGATDKQVEEYAKLLGQIERVKQLEDDRNKLAERTAKILEGIETPQEKLKKQLKEINDLYRQGALTREQARRAIDKAAEENGEGKGDYAERATLVVRRHDFHNVQSPRVVDKQSELADTAKRQLDSNQHSEYYLQQIWNNQQLNSNQTITVTW